MNYPTSPSNACRPAAIACPGGVPTTGCAAGAAAGSPARAGGRASGSSSAWRERQARPRPAMAACLIASVLPSCRVWAKPRRCGNSACSTASRVPEPGSRSSQRARRSSSSDQRGGVGGADDHQRILLPGRDLQTALMARAFDQAGVDVQALHGGDYASTVVDAQVDFGLRRPPQQFSDALRQQVVADGGTGGQYQPQRSPLRRVSAGGQLPLQISGIDQQGARRLQQCAVGARSAPGDGRCGRTAAYRSAPPVPAGRRCWPTAEARWPGRRRWCCRGRRWRRRLAAGARSGAWHLPAL